MSTNGRSVMLLERKTPTNSSNQINSDLKLVNPEERESQEVSRAHSASNLKNEVSSPLASKQPYDLPKENLLDQMVRVYRKVPNKARSYNKTSVYAD
jgi:hypothetical protein